jgi:hypothetical protein
MQVTDVLAGEHGVFHLLVEQLDDALDRCTNVAELRIAAEPLDVFRRYMASYAREQAYCFYSPALIDNLERNWEAKRRRL